MAFKDKIIVLTNNIYFQLAYFLSACGLIFLGVFVEEILICNIGGLLIAVPLFLFFSDVFRHITNPKYEEPLIPPVMPPNFKGKDKKEQKAEVQEQEVDEPKAEQPKEDKQKTDTTIK